jgi:hypothetical protein
LTEKQNVETAIAVHVKLELAFNRAAGHPADRINEFVLLVNR